MGNPGMQCLGARGCRALVPRLAVGIPAMQGRYLGLWGFGTWAGNEQSWNAMLRHLGLWGVGA